MGERKKRLDIQELTRELLLSPLSGDDALRQELEARGVAPNGAGALLYAMLEKAREGDLKAAVFLKELAEAAEAKRSRAKRAALPDLRTMSDEELTALAEGAKR